MVEKRTCDYTGDDIEPGTGTMFVRSNGTVLHFKDSKAEKNYLLGREARELEWTTTGREQEARAQAAREAQAARSAGPETVDETEAAEDVDEAETVDEAVEADETDVDEAETTDESEDADAVETEEAK